MNINDVQSLLDKGFALCPLYAAVNGKCTCGNPECKSKGKHPRSANGVKDATKLITPFENLNRARVEFNIGVATGIPSGVLVIDIDGDKGGYDSLPMLGDIPETYRVKTGHGEHIYFKMPPVELRNKVAILPGVDIRATGAYVVGEGSVHETGIVYSGNGLSTFAECPAHVLKVIQQSSAKQASEPLTFEYGRYNCDLFSLARSLRAKGTPPEAIALSINSVNKSMKDPEEQTKIDALIKSALTLPDEKEFKQQSIVHSFEQGFSPITGSEFGKLKFDNQEFIVENIIQKQSLVLLGAPPKVGKTTFAYALIGAITNNKRFLDLETEQCKVLLLSIEESKGMVQERLKMFHALNDNVLVEVSPLIMDDKLMQKITNTIKTNEISLVIIDTLSPFARFEDENGANSLTKMIPLLELRNTCGVTILAIHHTKKNIDGDDIIAAFRGSSAITAAADSLMWLKEIKKQTKKKVNGKIVFEDDECEENELTDERDFQRRLIIKSRLSGLPIKLKLQYDPSNSTFSAIGNSKRDVLNASLDKVYLSLNGNPLSITEIATRTKLNEKTIYGYIKTLQELGQISSVELSKFPPKNGYIRGQKQRKIV